MATIATEKPVWRGLDRFQSVTVKKAASQTFEAGDLVAVVSGLVEDYANDDTLLAVAGQDASQPEAPSGSPNADVVDLWRLTPNVIGEFNLIGTFAQSDIGADYGLVLTSGVPTIDKSDTTNTRVKVLALVEGAVGDTNVRVLARFLTDVADAVL